MEQTEKELKEKGIDFFVEPNNSKTYFYAENLIEFLTKTKNSKEYWSRLKTKLKKANININSCCIKLSHTFENGTKRHRIDYIDARACLIVNEYLKINTKCVNTNNTLCKEKLCQYKHLQLYQRKIKNARLEELPDLISKYYSYIIKKNIINQEYIKQTINEDVNKINNSFRFDYDTMLISEATDFILQHANPYLYERFIEEKQPNTLSIKAKKEIREILKIKEYMLQVY